MLKHIALVRKIVILSIYLYLLTTLIFCFTGCRKDITKPVRPTLLQLDDHKIPPRLVPLDDSIIVLPRNQVTLEAREANGKTGKFRLVEWTKISGSDSSVIHNRFNVKTLVTGLTEGIYHFGVRATDNNGFVQEDTMEVTVKHPTNGFFNELIFSNLVWNSPGGNSTILYSSQIFYPGRSLNVFAKTRSGWDLVCSLKEYDPQALCDYYYELHKGSLFLYSDGIPGTELATAIRVQY